MNQSEITKKVLQLKTDVVKEMPAYQFLGRRSGSPFTLYLYRVTNHYIYFNYLLPAPERRIMTEYKERILYRLMIDMPLKL